MTKVSLSDFKEELATAVKPEGFTKKDVSYLVDQMLEKLKENIYAMNEITFVGFGKWQTVTRHNVDARNPTSGESVVLPTHTRVVFKSAYFKKYFKEHPNLIAVLDKD